LIFQVITNLLMIIRNLQSSNGYVVFECVTIDILIGSLYMNLIDNYINLIKTLH